MEYENITINIYILSNMLFHIIYDKRNTNVACKITEIINLMFTIWLKHGKVDFK